MLTAVEVCVDCDGGQGVREAVGAAFDGGASAVELCRAMDLDGLTPKLKHIVEAREAFRNRCGLMVMIRPRGGDFCYSKQALRLMQQQIAMAAEADADGVVFGVLQAADNTVAIDDLKQLLKTSREYSLKTTFHRAFDATPRPLETLEVLIDLGVDRVLTSGTPWQTRKPAVEGIDQLAQMIDKAHNQIEVVIGGGVQARNVGHILHGMRANGKQMSVHAYSGVQVNGETTAAAVRELVRAVQSFPFISGEGT